MLGVCIYDHSAFTLAGGNAYMAQGIAAASMYRPRISGLRIKTGLANDIGGDQECSFTLAIDPLRGIFCGKGDLVFVYGSSPDPLWAGRISETPRIYGGQSRTEVHAKGCWVQLTERLSTGAIDWSAEYPTQHEVIGFAVRDLETDGLVARDLASVPNYDVTLGTGGFTIAAYSQYLADLIRTVGAFGDDTTPPAPTAFTVGGWRENYLGLWCNNQMHTAFEPPNIDTAVAGAGSVDFDNAGNDACRCIASGGAADGAIIYDSTQIRRTTYQRDALVRYMVKAKWVPTLGQGDWLGILAKVAAPACAAAATLVGQFIIRATQGVAGGWRIIYYDDAGTPAYWDEVGGAWAGGATDCYAGATNTNYIVCYEHNATGLKVSLWDATGVTKHAETDVVPWATWATKNTDRLWVYAGEPYTDFQQGILTIDWLKGWRWTSGSTPKLTALDLSDWEWETSTVELDSFTMTNPDESIANYVVASYGDPVAFTAVAQDADSIAKFGRRDIVVDATAIAPGAAALRLRDLKLEQAKDEVWRGSSITLRGKVRRKDGTRVPCWQVKAGQRMRVTNVNFPDGLTFMVGSTDYSDEDQTVSISPVDLPDSIALWLSQLSVRAL